MSGGCGSCGVDHHQFGKVHIRSKKKRTIKTQCNSGHFTGKQPKVESAY